MDKIFAYFENTEFVRRALSSDEQTRQYWKTYLDEHPEEQADIETARLILIHLKSTGRSVSRHEINSLFPGIYTKITRRKKSDKIRKLFLNTLKYAAMALLFFAMGTVITQYQYQNTIREISAQMANVSVFNGRHARLILSDGNSITLREKHSQVDYLSNGAVVINQTDTIPVATKSGKPGTNQIIVPYGKNSALTLPDGTVAHINAGSRLLFPHVFKEKHREVFLIGEGYFQVKHNPEKPFLVKTTDVQIEAVGTAFNVSAYASDKKIEVVLAEGKVHISENTFSLLNNKYTMQPNDILYYDKDHATIYKKQVKAENYTSWHHGFLNFESVELHKVIEKLERYYDIQASYNNSNLEQKKITGKLALQQEKDDVLQILATTANIQITRTEEGKYLIK
ncbi:FecR family protein [Gaoshiqia sp. Z1-71]|uniref:FecR family protein n=1 Tax=Gaoshiqia hydrogeniformans TaxID=3290090 RepID=UPI003BF7F1A7